jgi:cellulose synthase operon protein C
MISRVSMYARYLATALLFTWVLVVANEAAARAIHYGALSIPELDQCDALHFRGERIQARQCYRQLISSSADILVQAESSWAIGDIKNANTLFQNAVKSDPENALIRVRWGELFMQTYQYQTALELFQEALLHEPDNSFAQIGVAKALVERFESDARKYIDQVLKDENAAAGARYQAFLLLARMAMEATEMFKAVELLNEAETVAQENDISPLEVFALFASMDLLEGEPESEWITRVLEINPGYGDIYAIPGYFFWISRRYREAIELFSKAVEIEPDHWVAHMELGINLLRDNQVTRSRQHLEIAYGGDPYNPKTVNSLRLLDTFGDYDLINIPEVPTENTFPRVTFRLHKDESGVLKPYAEKLAEQGIREFTKRYQFNLKEPVIIEIYPNHDDFVVRTIGMPGVGILGATFGYLFAMDSPTDHPDNEYHWGTTFWHELAHVFTLEITDHLIPRWYSEGISVFEEWRYGPIKGIRIPVNVLDAMVEDKFLPIAELDSGFIRPSYDEQVIVSYMQAGLVCEFVSREFGFDKIVGMLAEFKNGIDTGQTVRRVLGISPEEFDERFDDFIFEEFGDLLGHLGQWKKLHQRAVKALAEEKWQDTLKAAGDAIEIFPEYVESDSPFLFMATAYSKLGDDNAELNVLHEYWQNGGYAPEAIWLLANKLYHRGRTTEAIDVLDSLNMVDPFDVELHSTLGDWLLEEGQYTLALTEYKVALAMEPHDKAAAYYRIANANYFLKQYDDARKNVLSSLEIAPHYRPAQKLLLETTRTQ